MPNKKIVGLDSAKQAAIESGYGANMTISAALVIEMVDRIAELESKLQGYESLRGLSNEIMENDESIINRLEAENKALKTKLSENDWKFSRIEPLLRVRMNYWIDEDSPLNDDKAEGLAEAIDALRDDGIIPLPPPTSGEG